jgi:uncharacterized membrane protein YgcG
VATLGVVVAPVIAVLITIAVADPPPSALVLVLVAVGAAVIAAVIGTALWRRRPESADIGFDQLMLWAWLHRRNAEERLERGASLLGLDRAGTPVGEVQISRERQLEVLHDLNHALESKDPYTHGHSQRVERHAYRTAFAMGLSVHEIEDLRRAAALHDVGKIRIPDRILRKPTQLTIEERAIVEEHVVVGAWMVSAVGNADVVSAVRHHHERWDGAGYPDGIAHSSIPLFARIIAVADAYDAITSTRPYRVSSDREFAVEVLRDSAGTQFDPEVVEAFVAALPLRTPVAGLLVLLAGPRLVFKEIGLWLRKLGAGNLGPAIGSVGAAVLLSSFVAAPAFRQDRPIPVRPIAQAHDDAAVVAEGGDTTIGKLPRTSDKPNETDAAGKHDAGKVNHDQVLGNRIARDLRGSLATVGGKGTNGDGNGGSGNGGNGNGGSGNGGSGNGGSGNGGSGNGGNGQPAPDPTPTEEPQPQPTPADGGDTGGDGGGQTDADEGKDKDKDKDHSDPNPDHGRDCEDHPSESSGNDKHCD